MEEQEQKTTADTGKKPDPVSDILEGIGRTIEEGIRSLGSRSNVLNVRIDDRSMEAIDALIAAGIFKTRSEAAAYLIDTGIESRSEVFSTITETARRISDLRDQMKESLRKGIKVEDGPETVADPTV